MSSEKVVQALLGVSEMSSRARFQFSVFWVLQIWSSGKSEVSDVGGVVLCTVRVAEMAKAGRAQQLWLLWRCVRECRKGSTRLGRRTFEGKENSNFGMVRIAGVEEKLKLGD